MIMKLVISIPVHESYPCVIDQVNNIRKYVPSSAVVVHVSGDSDDSFYESLVAASKKDYDGFLFINPTRYKTHKLGEAGNVTGLSSVYCDNFRFISKIMDFDFYSPSTSNEMFVRSGLESLMEKYSCQFDVVNVPTRADRLSHPSKYQDMANVLKNRYNCQYPEYGVVVGSFVSFDIWKHISDIILDELCKDFGSPLALDEYVIPTLIFNLYPELYNSIIPETYVFCPKDYNPNAPYISEALIMDIRNGKYPNRFVAKRVPRDINHPIRVFINSLS